MNKITTFTISALCIWAQAWSQEISPLAISGQITGWNGKKVYLEQYDNKLYKSIDSTTVSNGAFNFSTKVVLPELYGIRLQDEEYPLQVFLENNPIEITITKQNERLHHLVKGSALHQQFEALRGRKNLTAKELIQENPASLVSAYALFRNFSYSLSPQEIREHLTLLSPTLNNSQYVRILNDLAEKQSAVLPGNEAIDFTSTDPNGNKIQLSEYLGNGYVLLDFWASWCGPCRLDNPNIVAAFNKYKEKGFSVFGVSLDKDKESWIQAIADDKLEWTQVSDLAFWNTKAAALYGVRFIPSNLLIDPNGVIVARNLKGEKLQVALEEIYKKQQ